MFDTVSSRPGSAMALSQSIRVYRGVQALLWAAPRQLGMRGMLSLVEVHNSSPQGLSQTQRRKILKHHLSDLAQPGRASKQYEKFLRQQHLSKFVPSPDQGDHGTCYAHAISSATHSALLRIVGRAGGYPDVAGRHYSQISQPTQPQRTSCAAVCV